LWRRALLKATHGFQNIDPGFDRRNVLTAEGSPEQVSERGSADYREGEAMINFLERSAGAGPAIVGIESGRFHTISSTERLEIRIPLFDQGRVLGKNAAGPDEKFALLHQIISGLKTPLLRGRFFSESDNAHSAGSVIINKALRENIGRMKTHWGKRITFSDARKPDRKWLTIVGNWSEAFGIAGSISIQRRNIICRSRSALKRHDFTVSERARSPHAHIGHPARNQSIDPDQPIANVRTLETVTPIQLLRGECRWYCSVLLPDRVVAAERWNYGVISYLVVQRP